MAKSPSYTEYLDKLEKTLDEYFVKKTPALPKGLANFIVTIAPYLSILFVILSLPALLVIFGLGSIATVLAPLGGVNAMTSVPGMWVSIILLLPLIILEILAIPGLFARKRVGWRYIYWAQLISVISNIVNFSFMGLIFSVIVGFYIIFQIRSYYK